MDVEPIAWRSVPQKVRRLAEHTVMIVCQRLEMPVPRIAFYESPQAVTAVDGEPGVVWLRSIEDRPYETMFSAAYQLRRLWCASEIDEYPVRSVEWARTLLGEMIPPEKLNDAELF